jgi:prepilin-type N-terminal cleavage/methylation domain-containing protein
MNRERHINFSGVTLVELMIVSAIVSIVFLFLVSMIRNFGIGVTKIQRFVPMQRDLQLAKHVIEKDLLSAPRSSIGNAVPNPGFEAVPTRISLSTPTTQGFWACPPVRPRLNPFRSVQGFVTARPGFYLNGNYGLTLNVEGSAIQNTSYSADSSTFTLVAGSKYLFGGWFFENQVNAGVRWRLRLLRGSTWPETTMFDLIIANAQWKFYVATFTATSDNYRVVAGAFGVDDQQTTGTYDDIVVAPLAVDLVPGGPPFEFERFQVDGPTPGQRDRIRYRVVTDGSTGRLIRERITTTGVVVPMQSVNKIRRVLIGWDFGGSDPGVLPASTPNAVLFAKGMNFPLSVRIETGDVGATESKTLALTFSVFPEAP